MTLAARPATMTTEQLLALPDDGRERWLIAGELREGDAAPKPYAHSRTVAKVAYLIRTWMETPAGAGDEALMGAGICLRRNPDTTVVADVAYISPETVAANPDDDGILVGIPVLIVEVLSPSDTEEDINEKLRAYLDAGVKLVWIVDPTFRTITVYRADAEPELFNATQTISGEPHLRGFQVAVREVFER